MINRTPRLRRKHSVGAPARLESQNRDGGVAAVDRAMAILSAFDEDTSVLTLAELAFRTGMYKSTIMRLLASLERGGLVERGYDARYRIGPQAWRIGSLFACELKLENLLLPIMKNLSAETAESVSFYVPLFYMKPPMRMCLLRVEGPCNVRENLNVGDRLPLHKGSGGRIIRAFAELRREDNAIRKERVYISWGETDGEVCGIGAPVMAHDGLAGALVLSAPTFRHDQTWANSMKPLVLKAADEASQSLRQLWIRSAPKGGKMHSYKFPYTN
jgi:DNA-binding IclR family transcriptional regulator